MTVAELDMLLTEDVARQTRRMIVFDVGQRKAIAVVAGILCRAVVLIVVLTMLELVGDLKLSRRIKNVL